MASFYKKNILPRVKHGAGSEMGWGCFASSGAKQLIITDGTMTNKSPSEWLKKWNNENCIFFYLTQLLLSNIKLKDDDDVKHVIVTNMQKCEVGKSYLTKLQ